MALEILINGRRSEFAGDALAAPGEILRAIRADLAERGWTIVAARVDGAAIALDAIAAAGAVPIAAGARLLEIVAAPAPSEIDSVAADLAGCSMIMASNLEIAGSAFARGEWRRALSLLPPVLEELRTVYGGLQVVAALRCTNGADGAEKAEEWRALPEILAELNEHVSRRSWVDVADTILYRLVPMLKGLMEVAPSPP